MKHSPTLGLLFTISCIILSYYIYSYTLAEILNNSTLLVVLLLSILIQIVSWLSVLLPEKEDETGSEKNGVFGSIVRFIDFVLSIFWPFRH